MGPKIILFVCIHNSARSQMAEAFVNYSGLPGVKAESAGLEKGNLNPLVVDSMREIGIDISANQTKTVASMLEAGRSFDYVVTVCDGANGERCPIFPGKGQRLHWDLPDPSALQGNREEVLPKIAEIRDEIKSRVAEFLSQII